MSDLKYQMNGAKHLVNQLQICLKPDRLYLPLLFGFKYFDRLREGFKKPSYGNRNGVFRSEKKTFSVKKFLLTAFLIRGGPMGGDAWPDGGSEQIAKRCCVTLVRQYV